jgi:hypothetical protein
VDEEHVSSYVQHLEELKVCAQIRARERQTKINERRGKSYNDYNWPALSKERKLNYLTKQELKHYLKEHNLSYQGRKEDWIERITTHLSLGGKIINQHQLLHLMSSTNMKIFQAMIVIVMKMR